MARPRSSVLATALGFAIGFGLAAWAPWEGIPPEPATEPAAPAAFVLPVAAQRLWFPPIEEYDTGGEALPDAKFDALLATLRERMEADATLADFDREASVYLYSFARRVQIPELTPEQAEKAYAYYAELAERHPEHQGGIEKQRLGLEQRYAKANTRVGPFNAVTNWFTDRYDLDTRGDAFADEVVDQLLGVLDALLAMPETLADFENEAGRHLERFVWRLESGLVTDEQTARIVAYLDEVEAEHPGAGDLLEPHRFRIQHLLPGRTAPNIVGEDLEGVEFQLSDYRGRIVALYFSGQWCGPCRLEYPYKRAMLEGSYPRSWVTLLGVNSDADKEIMRKAKEDEDLDYRMWWDGHGDVPTRGPIAQQWKVGAWPVTYVIDGDGVIRYVNVRHQDVIVAVDALVNEAKVGSKKGHPISGLAVSL